MRSLRPLSRGELARLCQLMADRAETGDHNAALSIAKRLPALVVAQRGFRAGGDIGPWRRSDLDILATCQKIIERGASEYVGSTGTMVVAPAT
jgi:hypothetical protein